MEKKLVIYCAYCGDSLRYRVDEDGEIGVQRCPACLEDVKEEIEEAIDKKVREERGKAYQIGYDEGFVDGRIE
jgi:hypothetical protein